MVCAYRWSSSNIGAKTDRDVPTKRRLMHYRIQQTGKAQEAQTRMELGLRQQDYGDFPQLFCGTAAYREKTGRVVSVQSGRRDRLGKRTMPLSPETLKKCWVDFKVYKNPQARFDLINHYSYLVKITAGRLVTSMPGGLDREDLVGAGVIGLVKSVDQFDPTRDVKFETYAIALIRGAILEMLRDEDWVPRSIREKLKAMDRAQMALETKFGRPASDRELSEHLGISDQEVGELRVRMGRTNVYSLDDILGTGDGEDNIHFVELIVDDNANPGGEIEGKEIRRILGVGVDKLPERERLVIALYYYEGLTFKEIGKVLGVSESRVYQLHTQAMTRLRVHMRQEGAVHAG